MSERDKALMERGTRIFEEFVPERARAAEDQLRDWLEEHPRSSERSGFQQIMAITAEVSEVTARNYFHTDPERTSKVGSDSWKLLSAVAAKLGLESREAPEGRPRKRARKGGRRIALVTELDQLPSANFHFTLIRCLSREASLRHLSLYILPTHQEDLVRALPVIEGVYRPDGFVLLRLTPSPESLEQLLRAHAPVVLIHANLLAYKPPVIANVARRQYTLEADIRSWVEANTTRGKRKKPTVVLVGAPQEEEYAPYPLFDSNVGASLRNRRTRLVRTALESIESIRVEFMEVEDYSFHRAIEVYRQYPDADAYICLSDQIAVALKHLREASGKPSEGKIVGFDNTDLARSERISSFDQELEKTARMAIEALAGFLSQRPTDWPESETMFTEITLDRRD